MLSFQQQQQQGEVDFINANSVDNNAATWLVRRQRSVNNGTEAAVKAIENGDEQPPEKPRLMTNDGQLIKRGFRRRRTRSTACRATTPP
jgi:predicted NACHT family NTPase